MWYFDLGVVESSDPHQITVNLDSGRTMSFAPGAAGLSRLRFRKGDLVPTDSHSAHQAFDRAPRDCDALAPQLRPDLVGPVDASVLRPDAVDLGLQLRAAAGARPQRPLAVA